MKWSAKRIIRITTVASQEVEGGTRKKAMGMLRNGRQKKQDSIKSGKVRDSL